MASLNEVVGALINQIERGRAQADMGTLEIADIYKKVPFLSDFPIPKITLNQIAIDLKISVESIPTPENYFSAATRSKAVETLGEMVSDLHTKDKSLKEMLASDPTLKESWIRSREELLQKAAECIPKETDIDPDLIARNIGIVIRGSITSLITTPDLKIQRLRLHTYVTERTPEVEGRVVDHVRDILTSLLKEQPRSRMNMGVLVTASELQAISPEKITTLHLTFNESDKVWTQFETDNGETKLKLVPY